MDGAPLQHKIARVVAVDTQSFAQRSGYSVVLIPIGIQAVDRSAPGIEPPADPAQRPAVGYKRRPYVARPSVVALNFVYGYAGEVRHSCAGGGRIFGAGKQMDILFLGNLADHVQKSALCDRWVASPTAGANRPDQHGGAVSGKFGRHSKTVCGGQGA